MRENKDLYSVISLDEAFTRLRANLPQAGKETVKVAEAADRIAAAEVVSPEDLPAWPRSNMDGYAVRAADTHGASEGLPAYLEVVGSVVMGAGVSLSISERQAAQIGTGGKLPNGADAVVMVEHTERAGSGIEITRSVAPGENVVQVGEDFAKGRIVTPAHKEMTPAHLGALHALGIMEIEVFKKVRVYVISTGQELVSPDEVPLAGQIRDVNTTTLISSVIKDGAQFVGNTRVGDDYGRLLEALETAARIADIVLVTGGSSVSAHDYTAQAIESLGRPGVLAHGLSISPGKPTIIGAGGGSLVFGLSGHPGAALVVYHVLVRPILWLAQGGMIEQLVSKRSLVKAKLERNVVSKNGRTDFIRVKLEDKKGELTAIPILGPSGLIMTLTSADGIIKIPDYNEGLRQGQEVEVELW